MSKLTYKQEAFILDIIAGMTRSDAYRKHYCDKDEPYAKVNKNASALFNSKSVQARYKELTAEVKEKAFWRLEEATAELIWLKDTAKESIVDAGLKQANSNAFLNAIKELNNLNRLYVEEEKATTEDKVSAELGNLVAAIKARGKTIDATD